LLLSVAFICCFYLLLLSVAVAFGALFTISRRAFCVGAARLIDASCSYWRAFLRQYEQPLNGFFPPVHPYNAVI
jgi:hypothetical protein